MKKILILIVIIAIAYFGYKYATRPVTAPSQDINEVSQKLPAGSESSQTYRISQEGSLATFSLNELLNGKPKLVIGTTTQIAGDISYKDGRLEIGTLTLNAKTLVTDNPQRNSAIVRFILKSEKPENEFITFKPTSQATTSVALGAPASFDVTGDLTISGVTKPVTFKVTAMVTDSTITGKAETRLKRSDFNLVIPTLSFIADVDDEFPVSVDIKADRIMQ